MVLKPQPKPADRRDFAEYERLVRHWLRRFGLTDWRALFELQPVDGSQDDRRATVYMSISSRTARFILRYGRGPSTLSIARTSLHEVVHVLLADMVEVAGRRGSEHDDTILEEHKLIERLIPVLLPEEGHS